MAVLVAGHAGAQGDARSSLPDWMFPVDPPAPAPAPAPANTAPNHVPGSRRAFTLAEVTDRFNAPDWRPQAHPPMPQVVAHGRQPDMFACGYCHLPNGQGRPENAALAGLKADYIAEQLAAYRTGARTSSDPIAASRMRDIAQAITPAETKAAADYFAALRYRRWVRVVESPTAPRTRSQQRMLAPVAGGGTEPIGERVIETPADLGRTELRDAASGFIAYVPPGSIRRGEALVRTGGGGAQPCGACHGADLKGAGAGPPLAGRSPAYVVRQLYDFQHGARSGPASAPMKAVVARLSVGDMVAIAAYTASRAP